MVRPFVIGEGKPHKPAMPQNLGIKIALTDNIWHGPNVSLTALGKRVKDQLRADFGIGRAIAINASNQVIEQIT